jgi:hypothetical protein
MGSGPKQIQKPLKCPFKMDISGENFLGLIVFIVDKLISKTSVPLIPLVIFQAVIVKRSVRSAHVWSEPKETDAE